MIEVKYKNNEKEFAEFSMHRALNSEKYQKAVKLRSYVVSAMLCIAGIVYFIVSRKMQSETQSIGVGFAMVFFVLGVLNLFVFKYFVNSSVKKSIVKNLKSNKELLEKNVKVKFDGKVLTAGRGKEKQVINKEDILEVVNLNECICIAVNNNPGLVIPYSAFKNEEEKNKFEECINNYK